MAGIRVRGFRLWRLGRIVDQGDGVSDLGRITVF